jgi:uncharacterized lipoprotein
MFKVVAAALVVGLLAACSSMSGSSYRSSPMDRSNAASADPPRSPGEGPSFTPYGAAGH